MIHFDFTSPIFAQSTGGGIPVGIDILEYLKYGTLGLAGIILLLAFFLFRQSNGLTDTKLMELAQTGVDKYMTVAKWLLIPCMLLQILGIIVDSTKKPIIPPPVAEEVAVFVTMPPVPEGDSTVLGKVTIKVWNEHDDTPKIYNGNEEGEMVKVKDGARVAISLRDMTNRITANNNGRLPESPAMAPTALD